jgi:hypothetical protein
VRQERSRPLISNYRRGCENRAPSSPGTTIRPRQSIIASAAGTHLPASLMRDGFACRTMPPNASYGPCPDTSPPPANEAVVARGVWTNASGRSRQGAPDRKTQKVPLRTRRSFTRGTTRGLLGSIGLMATHS